MTDKVRGQAPIEARGHASSATRERGGGFNQGGGIREGKGGRIQSRRGNQGGKGGEGRTNWRCSQTNHHPLIPHAYRPLPHMFQHFILATLPPSSPAHIHTKLSHTCPGRETPAATKAATESVVPAQTTQLTGRPDLRGGGQAGHTLNAAYTVQA